MTAEGWNGQSIRQHVDGAASVAAEALEAAQLASAEAGTAAGEAARALGEIEGVQDDLRALTQRLDSLSEGRGLAESAHDEIATLRVELAELAAKVGRAGDSPSHGVAE